MSDELSIGNVRFNKNDVAGQKVSTTDAGDRLYSVFLKNGTKVHFYDQQASSNASVTVGYDSGNKNKYGTAFNGIQGMTIEGSNKDDYYHLMNCDYYEVETRGGGKDEVRIVNTKGNPTSATTRKDTLDNVYTVDTSNGISMSEGVFVREQKPINTTSPKPNPNNGVTTIKDNLKGLTPEATLVTSQNCELRSYKDANGNTVVRVDYNNDDPEELFAEEEVISPDGKLISFTERSSDGNGVNGYVCFDKYVYDENEDLVKLVTTEYENGKLVSTKEVSAEEFEENSVLVGSVMPGIVIEDTERKNFLEARGAKMAGRR